MRPSFAVVLSSLYAGVRRYLTDWTMPHYKEEPRPKWPWWFKLVLCLMFGLWLLYVLSDN